jgi:hypothetical protein
MPVGAMGHVRVSAPYTALDRSITQVLGPSADTEVPWIDTGPNIARVHDVKTRRDWPDIEFV